MFLQNYQLDAGYIYNFTSFNYFQSLEINTIVNENPTVVLQTLLPTIRGQLTETNNPIFCPLRKRIITRRVEIELQNNTKYTFDIPFNADSNALYDALINDLANPLIKSWEIKGEQIKGDNISLILTKVP